jgi:hypothetical protein
MYEKGPNKSSTVWAIAIALLLVIVPLYVLSIGPAVYFLSHGFGAWEGAMETFYAPLIWVANNCEPLGSLLKTYIAWWGG